MRKRSTILKKFAGERERERQDEKAYDRERERKNAHERECEKMGRGI